MGCSITGPIGSMQCINPMETNTTQNKLEKESFHNKEHIQQAREQHKSKIKQAIDLIEATDMTWKQKQQEYKRLSKIKFAYFKKSNAQLELEKSIATVKSVQALIND